MKKEVVVVIGAGGIGIAIARRQGFGRTILLSDWNETTLAAAAQSLREASYSVDTAKVDVASRASVHALAATAANVGSVVQVVNTAGLSPNMADAEQVLRVDLYGAAVVFEEFEPVIAPGGAGLVISSMAGHMQTPLQPEEEHALAYLPADELLNLPLLKAVPDSMAAYILAKRANHLRVQAAAMSWGAKRARVNSLSPGIILTPLALHELNSPIGDGYRAMVAASPARRMAPPEEIAIAASYLLGSDADFITGSDLLIDGGVIAAMRAGKLSIPG